MPHRPGQIFTCHHQSSKHASPFGCPCPSPLIILILSITPNEKYSSTRLKSTLHARTHHQHMAGKHARKQWSFCWLQFFGSIKMLFFFSMYGLLSSLEPNHNVAVWVCRSNMTRAQVIFQQTVQNPFLGTGHLHVKSTNMSNLNIANCNRQLLNPPPSSCWAADTPRVCKFKSKISHGQRGQFGPQKPDLFGTQQSDHVGPETIFFRI